MAYVHPVRRFDALRVFRSDHDRPCAAPTEVDARLSGSLRGVGLPFREQITDRFDLAPGRQRDLHPLLSFSVPSTHAGRPVASSRQDANLPKPTAYGVSTPFAMITGSARPRHTPAPCVSTSPSSEDEESVPGIRPSRTRRMHGALSRGLVLHAVLPAAVRLRRGVGHRARLQGLRCAHSCAHRPLACPTRAPFLEFFPFRACTHPHQLSLCSRSLPSRPLMQLDVNCCKDLRVSRRG